MANGKDIQIGLGETIPWIEFEPGEQAYEIDHIIGKYRDFWSFLQIHCVIDCCGIDALRFFPEDIMNASQEVDAISFKKDLMTLKLELCASKENIVSSVILNNLIHKTVFMRLTDHIAGHLK